MYEMHIAAEVLPTTTRNQMFDALAAVGIQKSKFFYKVHDVRPSTDACHPAGTPPTGHDLATPGSMSTVKVESYAEAQRLVKEGMEVLARLGIKGNFEIEGLIGPKISDYPAIDVEGDFPGYSRVDDAPAYENHIIWKAPANEMPSDDQIIGFFEQELGTTPHQIVDFGRDAEVTPTTVVSRVATVYQPSREATLAFAKRLKGVKNTLEYRYAVAEQVLLVGEPTH